MDEDGRVVLVVALLVVGAVAILGIVALVAPDSLGEIATFTMGTVLGGLLGVLPRYKNGAFNARRRDDEERPGGRS